MHFALPTSGLNLPCVVPNFTGIPGKKDGSWGDLTELQGSHSLWIVVVLINIRENETIMFDGDLLY